MWCICCGFRFSALLGIPPESQSYDVGSMRLHLKNILNSKQVLPFPTSVQSEMLASYFSQQSDTLRKKSSASIGAKTKSKSQYMKNKRECSNEGQKKIVPGR